MSPPPEKLFATLVQQMPTGVAILHGEELRVVYSNQAVQTMLGLPAADYNGRRLDELIPGMRPFTLKGIRQVIITGKPMVLHEFESPIIITAEGKPTFWDADYQPVDWSGNGKIDAVVLMLQNVTDHVELRTKAEQRAREAEATRAALTASEQRFRSLAETSVLGILVTDVSENFKPLFANAAAAQMLGYESVADLLARPSLSDLLVPRAAERLRDLWQQLLNGAITSVADEIELMRQGAPPLWVSGTGTIVNWNGRPALQAVLADVTARRHAEAQLAGREKMLQLALQSADMAAWDYDYASDTMQYSASRDRLYGESIEGPVKFGTVLKYVHPDDREGLVDAYRRAIDGGAEYVKHEFRGMWPDGSIRWLASRARIERDDAGLPKHIFGVDIDITAEKASRERLEQFARTVAHDLRSPLQTVRAFSELLARTTRSQLNEDNQKFLDQIGRGVERMDVLVEGLLDYASAVHGRIEREPVDLEKVLTELLASLKKAIDAADATINHTPLPTVSGHRVLLTQVLQNLISNALKFRAERPLEINVTAQHNNHEWIISVSDNGLGIPTVHHDKLFEAFTRAHRERDIPGLGLGLSLVQQAVAQHGGRVWLESVAGGGTTFHFTIPDAA